MSLRFLVLALAHRRATLALMMLFVVCGVVTWPVSVMAQDKPSGSAASQDSLFHGRLADPRIGYMTEGPYIRRWRFDRQDPSAVVSDVVHPVVYVIDTSVPAKWRPDVIQSVKVWLPVLESIGFRNALTVRVAAPKDSTPESNVVIITMSTDSTQSSMATDCTARPTTGELTRCMIKIGSGIVERNGQIVYILTSGGDPSIPLPLPDSLLGLYLQSAMAHEVGHSLGLAHNWHAGIAYPTDSLRSAAFVRRWGYTASVMMYRFYNEVAQPEDHIPYRDRVFRIGPYDAWALAWAYRPIPGAATPEAEQPTLAQWRTAQDTASYLRMPPPAGPTSDVTFANEAWGGDDILKATKLWFRNAVRLSQRLASSPKGSASRAAAPTTFSPDFLETLQIQMVQMWSGKLSMVIGLIGGQEVQPPYPLDPNAIRTTPIPVPRQLEAMRLVLASALYGQDPIMGALKGTSDNRTAKKRTSSADSTPIIFDVSSNASSAITSRQSAQQVLLSSLTRAASAMPREARPEMCRYFSDALAALARVEARPQLSAGEQTELKALQKLFLTPSARLCPGH